MTPRLADVSEQIARPQRVAVWGRHGAGKTTLLAMLYREALAGRLAGMRLAAADERTASSLGELARRLEEGEPLGRGSAPEEFRFHFSRGGSELELVFVDSAGELLPECDAVWLCVEATRGSEPLAPLPSGVPLAVLLTRADLLSSLEASNRRACLNPFAQGGFEQAESSPDRAAFAVSALGPSDPATLQPSGLEPPLAWLADTLHRQTRSRLERLFKEGGRGRRRALEVFRQRYPEDPLGKRLPMPGRWDIPAMLALATLCVGWACLALWPEKKPPAEAPPEPVAQAAAPDALAALDADRGDLPSRLARASRLAEEHAGQPEEGAFRSRQAALGKAMEDASYQRTLARDVRPEELARRMRGYLTNYPTGERAAEVRKRLAAHLERWSHTLYSRLRARYLADPGDVKWVRPLATDYLAHHPTGRWAKQAREIRDWCDRIAQPHGYSVTAVSGVFTKKAALTLSRGLSLSVTLEVAGETYGPSSIVKNSYFPEWRFAFPRPVRWKRGDSVRVIVTDNYFWKRKISDVTFDGSVALARLDSSCDVGAGTMKFWTDLKMPRLPKEK